jgi:hypothetical protein
MAEVDAARFEPPLGGDPEPEWRLSPEPGPPPGPVREPVGPRGGGPAHARVRHRVRSDDRPSVSALLAAYEKAASDPSVVEYALDPWPRRVVRSVE